MRVREYELDKEEAQTVLSLSLSSVSTEALQTNQQGYVDLYRTHVTIEVVYQNGTVSKRINVSGSHDFSVTDGSVVSDAKKFEAIKRASSKAMEEMISKLALETFRDSSDTSSP